MKLLLRLEAGLGPYVVDGPVGLKESEEELLDAGCELEGSLTDIWHGGTPGVSDLRFELDLDLDLDLDPTSAHLKKEERSIIVSFSSLGDYLIRPEFKRTLEGLAVDKLFVMDPACSWFMNDPSCRWQGYSYYERKIEEITGPYKHVIMLGDSMGGSGSLLFSHLCPR